MTTTSEKSVARRGSGNLVIGQSGKPLLIIVQGTDIDRMLDEGLQAIGGLGKIIRDNRRVLLKPNTNQRDPFPSTTAPETLRAIARHCHLAGADQITVHEDHKEELDLYYHPEDLPGIDIELSHGPNPDHYVLVEYPGWHGDLDPLVDLSKQVPDGTPERILDSSHRLLGRLQESGYQRIDGPFVRVARQLQDAPIIINLPVLKRHFAGQITSALKNHFGSVFAPQRWLAHSSLPTNRDYFDRKIAEFASAVRPELTITDVRSLQAVTGPGRNAETQIIENVNKIIITGDMVAADTVATQIMAEYDSSFTAKNISIIKRQHEHAMELGLGTDDLSQLEIINLKTD